jgi:hypothetical protein
LTSLRPFSVGVKGLQTLLASSHNVFMGFTCGETTKIVCLEVARSRTKKNSDGNNNDDEKNDNDSKRGDNKPLFFMHAA